MVEGINREKFIKREYGGRGALHEINGISTLLNIITNRHTNIKCIEFQ